MQRVKVYSFAGMLGESGSKTVPAAKIQKAINDFLHEFPTIKVLDVRICSDAAPVSSPSEPHMGSVFEVFVVLLYEADESVLERLRKSDSSE